MNPEDEDTVDEARLAALAGEAVQYIRRHGAAVDLSIVAAELQRLGCSAEEAADAITHGVSTGVLVMLGSTSKLDAGFTGGRLP